MNVIQTKLKDCFIIEPQIIKDERGYFFESFNERTFAEKTGIKVHFVQDNQSFSSKGVLRGLHYQTGAFAQAKLVQVLQGAVLDVAVDIRPESETYGRYVTAILSAENKNQMFIPRGFAHGFLVLSDTALFSYKCDNFYHKESEGGIAFDDSAIGIDWNFPKEQLIISEKDQNNPTLENARKVW
ncbi:MAG: dTDP-4-dehydrorhamnose 3,5-epimerase [Flavobacteriaceae bacterium]